MNFGRWFEFPNSKQKTHFPNDPSKLDWTKREVLVGSLGSQKQLEINLRRKFYYVPARYLSSVEAFGAEYVAIYQSAYQPNPGIRYFAKIKKRELRKRKKIPVPIRKNNPTEDYWYFRLEGWQILPKEIEIQTETVQEPKFTSLFLLSHASASYELFQVTSLKDYRLLDWLKQAKESDSIPPFSQNGLSLQKEGERLCLRREGRLLFAQPLSSLEANPSTSFCRWKEKFLVTK